jgi:hypothetical protein
MVCIYVFELLIANWKTEVFGTDGGAVIPSVLYTRKFRYSPLFAICCRAFTGRIAHRHVILSRPLPPDMDIHLVFSPFTARQLALLVTRHLSALIITCVAQL